MDEFNIIKEFKVIDEVAVEYNPVLGKYEVSVSGIDSNDSSNLEVFIFDNKKDAYNFQDAVVNYFQ